MQMVFGVKSSFIRRTKWFNAAADRGGNSKSPTVVSVLNP